MPTPARVCAWIVSAGLVAPCVALGQDRTEREIVDLIVRDGPRARAIRAESEVTRREQLARLAHPNPSVMYSREGAGFTEFLQLEQTLLPFGVRAALSRAGVEATAAAEAERDARLWMLRADAANTVARLIGERERLGAFESYSREIERLVEVLRTREREGEGSRFDRLRAEQEFHDARQSVTAAAIAVADARAAVAAMLPSETMVGSIAGGSRESQLPLPADALLARARAVRAELRALDRAAVRADIETQAARRAQGPAPTVFGGLKRADDGSRRERGGVLGVSVSLPLFDTGDRDAARWAAERSRVDAERAAVEEQIRAELARASEALALRHSAVSQHQERAGEELMRIADVAYREGELGILGLLDAVRTTSRARIRSIDIRLDARLAQIALERAVGEILWP